MNSRLGKTIAAVFGAPVMTGILMGIILSMGENPEGQRVIMQMTLFGAILVGVPSTLIIGLPVHALLLAMRWTRWWSYAIAGGACGILCAAVLYGNWYLLEILWGFGRSSEGVDCLDASGQPAICPDQTAIMVVYVQFVGLLIVGGTITVVCGWLIRRPDRDRATVASTIPQEPAVDA